MLDSTSTTVRSGKMEIRTKAREIAIDAAELFSKLRISQRLYLNTILCFVLFIIAKLVVGLPTALGFLLLFMFFWVWAIGYDLIGVYKKLYKKPLGKAFFLLMLSLATNFSIMLGCHVVNDLVGIDPSKFPHTVALLSILNIPVFVMLGLTLIYGAILLLAPFLVIFHMLPNEKVKEAIFPGYSAPEDIPLYKTTLAIQVASIAFFTGFVLAMSGKLAAKYDEYVTRAAQEFIFQMEMYPKAQCDLPKGVRAAFVSDDKVLTAFRAASGIDFGKPRDCKVGS